MRINYTDEEDRPGQFELWQANCRRSLQGKTGQQELRELEAALAALPVKRLIHGALEDEHGGVCAIAAYAKHKGHDISKADPEDESDIVGIEAGMPRLVAWKVVEMNDLRFDDYYWDTAEGPTWDPFSKGGGYQVRLPCTPEKRYELMLAWVRSELLVAPAAVREGP